MHLPTSVAAAALRHSRWTRSLAAVSVALAGGATAAHAYGQMPSQAWTLRETRVSASAGEAREHLAGNPIHTDLRHDARQAQPSVQSRQLGEATRVDSSSILPPREEVIEPCDCAPLWQCMQIGGDCNGLRAELDACLARTRSS